jgi:hypothetical protein
LFRATDFDQRFSRQCQTFPVNVNSHNLRGRAVQWQVGPPTNAELQNVTLNSG